MPADKAILWDFDGTLGHRPGMWRTALVEALVEYDPTCTITAEDLRSVLRDEFPWHRPDLAHPHITTAEVWWAEVEQLFIRTYRDMGYSALLAERLASLAHKKYLDVQGWLVYDDALPTLHHLAREGWRQAILSNHVPELAHIVDHLGLTPYLEVVISSALQGYEKPHPRMFYHALARLDHPKMVYMIGDNIEADVLGAEAVGIPAILVRNPDARATRFCPDLLGVPTLLSTDQDCEHNDPKKMVR